jgi:hypothetical protein
MLGDVLQRLLRLVKRGDTTSNGVQKPTSHGVKVLDLDLVVSEPLIVTLHGRDHLVEPLSTVKVALVLTAIGSLETLQKRNVIDSKELIQVYKDLFRIVAPSITPEDVDNMDQRQAAMLFQFVCDLVGGKAYKDLIEDEKKNPKYRLTKAANSASG